VVVSVIITGVTFSSEISPKLQATKKRQLRGLKVGCISSSDNY